MIEIQLSAVKKRQNKGEWRFQNCATAEGLKSVGDGPVIINLCKMLVDAGKSPLASVTVWRGDMLVFTEAPLGLWASGKVGRGEQPSHLRDV